MHYPKEYAERTKKDKMKVIFNNVPYQDIMTVLFGYYCIYFLHRWTLGEDSYDILRRLSLLNDVMYNEKFIEEYFKNFKVTECVPVSERLVTTKKRTINGKMHLYRMRHY